jgi:hypothetical protein
MGYHLNAERLHFEIKTFLENDRIPERRMWDRPNYLETVPPDSGTRGFRELYARARQLDQWPGDRWQEPIGSHRNPFLRQSKNIPLATIILADPSRQQEAYDKLIDAGYKPEAAKELLSKHHDKLEITEGQ